MVLNLLNHSKTFRKSTKIIGIANAFSGGIFFGIALFHLLPESVEGFKQYFKYHNYNGIFSKIPLSFFIAFISYSFVLFIEKVAFDSHSLLDGHNHNHASDQKLSNAKRDLNVNEQKGIYYNY